MRRVNIFVLLLMGYVSMMYAQTVSDFLAGIRNIPAAQRQAKVDSFLAAQSRFPVVENNTAWFIFAASFTHSVQVAGDFNGWSPSAPFDSVYATNLFYRSFNFESDARLDYKLIINGSDWILDPRNPNAVMGGYGPNSELAMPDYVQPEEINYSPLIPHGGVDQFNFSSTLLGNTRQVSVYLPFGYHAGQSTYPVVYVHDGGEYLSLANMNNTLDYLIATGRIQPVVAVMVNPVDRNNEYWMNDRFGRFFTEELIPYIRNNYRVASDADSVGVMGASLGGLTSMYFCWKYPEFFGRCGSQSGAFWVDNGAILDSLSQSLPTTMHVYLDWGTYETSIRSSNLAMMDFLTANGLQPVHNEWHEGHSWGNWRAHEDNLLEALFPAGPNTIPADVPSVSSTLHIRNYPNPFNGTTRIEFTVPAAGNYELHIYDVSGKLVRTYALPGLSSGPHSVTWKATNTQGDSVATGIYFYTFLQGNRMLKSGNMLYLK